MRMKYFLCKIAAAIGMLVLFTQCDAEEQKPNIIFIIADDLGYSDIGVYSEFTDLTPNIDKMASEGMRFTQAYSGSTVCAPSRSTLLTGTHTGNTSVRGNTGGISLQPDDITIGDLLREAGYATGGFGKWGIAEVGTPGVPEKKGFDTFFGYYHQIHAHYYYPDFLYRNSERVHLPGNEGFYDGELGEGSGVGPVPSVHPETGLEPEYTHYRVFEEMKEFIREHHEGPFFAYAPWTPPHSRFEMPEEDPAWQKYKDEPWPLSTRMHASMISMIDRHVGELFELLKELGIDDNTVVFFTSDNGASVGMNRGALQSNYPFSGGKTRLTEGGLRVPFVAWWPGKIPESSVSDHPTYFPDVLPTLAEIAGISDRVPEVVNGISILPELTGSGSSGRSQQKHPYLYWEYGDNNWSEIRYMPETLQQTVRYDNWKAIRTAPGEPLQLFNLEVDIGEEKDVAASHPEIVAKIEQMIKEAHSTPPPQIEPERIHGRRWR